MKYGLLFRGMMLVTLLVASGLGSGCAQTPLQSKEMPTPTPLPTLAAPTRATYQVERGSISDVLVFDGRIVPVQQKDLFFKINGRVRKVYVQEGDTLKAGQILADLDVVDQLESGQASRQRSQRRAQIQVDMAQNSLDLFKLTTPKYVTGYTNLLAAKNYELELAKLNLDEASMGVSDISKSIADASITASIAGQLVSFRVKEGDSVEAYKAYASVADVNQLEISADPKSEILTRISEGMAVTAVDVNNSEKKLNGTVRRLPYVSTSDSTANQVRIRLETPPSTIGMRMSNLVQVSIVLRVKENTLLLAPQAIRTFEGRNFVLVKNGNLQQRVDVKIGIKDDTHVEILEGLSEGQVIIAP